MRVGVDIGGTFTDLVADGPDGIVVRKVASTPADPSQAFLSALARLDGGIDEVRHGTTVATNAVLTRTGARLGFVTTRGFRHLLHLARQDRPSLYDQRVERPSPLVDEALCVGVAERVGPDGTILEPLDVDDAREVVATLRGVEGVVVTLLHSYASPEHEERIGALLREVLGDVDVSLSSRVLPEFREYERASTTALNAYVQPVMQRYLGRIGSGVAGRIGVMWSGGGVRSIERTVERPVHTLFSGPAAGVLGAAWVCRDAGFDDLVTLDMGGTSADVALVDGGRPEVSEGLTIDGLPFHTPTLDVVSVGAGGGSIAWVDEGGALRVGPTSAGADPGPACYGRGGSSATVTDAQVVLGYLGDEGLAGGELTLDRDAASAAVERLARQTGLTVEQTAEGILRVVRATMARAIRSVSVERGKDVRRYALVAFGGAGPLHATALARELEMPVVVVPPAPGALAALGLLVAGHRADASVSRPMTAEPAADAELRSILDGLRRRVTAELELEGVAAMEATLEPNVDCRYEGQSHELRIPVEGVPSFDAIVEAFHDAHRARYGFSRPDAPVEGVTYRVAALGPRTGVTLREPPADGAVALPKATRRVGEAIVDVHERSSLPAGARITGPAIVAELDSTTWIDARSRAQVAPNGALVIDVS